VIATEVVVALSEPDGAMLSRLDVTAAAAAAAAAFASSYWFTWLVTTISYVSSRMSSVARFVVTVVGSMAL